MNLQKNSPLMAFTMAVLALPACALDTPEHAETAAALNVSPDLVITCSALDGNEERTYFIDSSRPSADVIDSRGRNLTYPLTALTSEGVVLGSPEQIRRDPFRRVLFDQNDPRSGQVFQDRFVSGNTGNGGTRRIRTQVGTCTVDGTIPEPQFDFIATCSAVDSNRETTYFVDASLPTVRVESSNRSRAFNYPLVGLSETSLNLGTSDQVRRNPYRRLLIDSDNPSVGSIVRTILRSPAGGNGGGGRRDILVATCSIDGSVPQPEPDLVAVCTERRSGNVRTYSIDSSLPTVEVSESRRRRTFTLPLVALSSRGIALGTPEQIRRDPFRRINIDPNDSTSGTVTQRIFSGGSGGTGGSNTFRTITLADCELSGSP